MKRDQLGRDAKSSPENIREVVRARGEVLWRCQEHEHDNDNNDDVVETSGCAERLVLLLLLCMCMCFFSFVQECLSIMIHGRSPARGAEVGLPHPPLQPPPC